MLLADLLVDLYWPLRGIGDRTVTLYRYSLDAWAEMLGRPPCLDDCDETAVARFLSYRGRHRSPATVAKDRAQIVALWSFAAKRGLVTKWPEVRRIKVPERVPEAWTAEEFRRLLAYDTAERVSAMRHLRWCDVRDEDVIFRAETRKGNTRDICRQIGDHTRDAIDAIREPRRDLVFPWDRGESYLWKRLGIIQRRAGLPDDRRSKFHRIRRTTASFYAAAGHSAQQLLDHSSPAVTRRYLDPRIVRSIAAPDVLPKVG